jgi:hypothetical protein
LAASRRFTLSLLTAAIEAGLHFAMEAENRRNRHRC